MNHESNLPQSLLNDLQFLETQQDKLDGCTFPFQQVESTVHRVINLLEQEDGILNPADKHSALSAAHNFLSEAKTCCEQGRRAARRISGIRSGIHDQLKAYLKGQSSNGSSPSLQAEDTGD